MAKENYKDKRESGGFVPLPYCVLRSNSYARLSAYAVKLLNDLLAQYNGHNNGDLCATWSLMERRGWRSRSTLCKALAELKRRQWVEVTRQGGRHRATLLAVTFYSIDNCRGKLDVDSTLTPRGLWRNHEPPPALKIRRPYTPGVPMG